MQTQYTPGPWTVDPTKSFYVFGPARLAEQAGVSHGPFVCNASTGANARLIAAAPDLVDALRDVLRELETHAPRLWAIPSLPAARALLESLA